MFRRMVQDPVSTGLLLSVQSKNMSIDPSDRIAVFRTRYLSRTAIVV
jgi:hypothetical protein